MSRAVRPAGLLAFLSLFLVASCKSDEPLERTSVGKGRDSDLTKKDTSDKETTPTNSATKKKKKKKPGDADSEDEVDEEDTGDKEKEETPADIDFPQLSFKGNGYTTYKLKDRLTMRMGIDTQLDEDSLTIDTRSAKVECGSKSGCNQGEVDRDVNATSLGLNVYQRLTPAELKELKSDGFNAAAYAIFAKSVRGKNGYTFTFDKPIPVYPWPASKSRYEPLESGPESWTTTVTADKYVPLRAGLSPNSVQNDASERAGNAKKTFSATVSVSMQSLGSGQVKLTFDLNLPDDRDRMLYKYFPLPRSSAFTIDTDKKDVRAVSMTNWSNGDKSKEPEESVLEYKLCSKTTSSDTKTFNCE
jgi:hypothetical protein